MATTNTYRILSDEKWGKPTAASRPPVTCAYCGDSASTRIARYDGETPYCSAACLLQAANEVPEDADGRLSAGTKYRSAIQLLLSYMERRKFDKFKEHYPIMLKLEAKREAIPSRRLPRAKRSTKRRDAVDAMARRLGLIG